MYQKLFVCVLDYIVWLTVNAVSTEYTVEYYCVLWPHKYNGELPLNDSKSSH